MPIQVLDYFTVASDFPDEVEAFQVAAWIFPPVGWKSETPLPVAICLPGGSYTKSYYHLEVAGEPVNAYSMASFLAQRGILAIALDHLGVGESSHPQQGHLLTAEMVAAANASVVQQVRQRLADGTLLASVEVARTVRCFGVGHSMGAFLALVQQAKHKSFDALALLGWTSIGEIGLQGAAVQAGEVLGQQFNADTTLNTLLHYTPAGLDYLPSLKTPMHALFYAPDVPLAVVQADEAQGTVVPTGVMETLRDVGYVQQQASVVDVPLLLANSDWDVSPNVRDEPKAYERATDITVYELDHSAHCHNFASTRMKLWERLSTWVQTQCR